MKFEEAWKHMLDKKECICKEFPNTIFIVENGQLKSKDTKNLFYVTLGILASYWELIDTREFKLGIKVKVIEGMADKGILKDNARHLEGGTGIIVNGSYCPDDQVHVDFKDKYPKWCMPKAALEIIPESSLSDKVGTRLPYGWIYSKKGTELKVCDVKIAVLKYIESVRFRKNPSNMQDHIADAKRIFGDKIIK